MTNRRAGVSLSILAAAVLSAVPALAQTKPAMARALTVRVIDSERQAPVGGAEVWLEGDHLQELKVMTDEQGVAQLQIGAEAKMWYVVTVKADTFSPLRYAVNARGDSKLEVPAEVAFQMTPGKQVGGIVLDAEGAPVEGATVVLDFSVEGLPKSFSSAVRYRKVKTDAEGKWTFPLVPAQAKRIAVGAYHVERGGNEHGFFPMNSLEQQTDRDALYAGSHRIILPPAQAITGTVTDENGQPIAGAQVQVGDDSVASNSLPAAKSDEQGRFTVGVLRDANVTLTIKAPKRAPQLVKVQASSNAKPIDVKLEPAQLLRGKVVDKQGQPIAEARVFVDSWRGTRTLNTSLTTNAAGEFEWPDAPADDVLINVLAPGYASNRTAKVAPGKENVIVLQKPITFIGTVIDANTKQPIKDFKVRQGYKHGNGPTQFYRDDRDRVIRDADQPGTFRIVIDEPRNDVVYGVVASGYAPAESGSVPSDAGDQTFTYELQPATDLSGKVVDSAGKPAAGVMLYLVQAGRHMPVENGRVAGHYEREVETARPDETGAFSFPPTSELFKIIAIADAGYGSIDSTQFKAGSTITLQPWAHVSGVVKSGTKPAPNTKVKGWLFDQSIQQGMPNVMNSFEAVSDASGRFVVERTAPGTYRVGKDITIGSGRSRMQTSSSLASIEVGAGQSVEVTIGGQGRKVKGTILLPEESLRKEGARVVSVDLATKIVLPTPPEPPEDFQSMTPEQRKAYIESDEMKAFTKAQNDAYIGQYRSMSGVSGEGAFEFEDVPPGEYVLTGEYAITTETNPYGERLGRVSEVVRVEEGDLDTPVQLSPAPVTLKTTVEVGQPAPAFEAPALDGQATIRLADFKGKVVLLDFWATWCGPCVAEVPHLKRVYEKFGSDPRFAMVSLSLDDSKAPLEKFVKKEGTAWTQGYLGPWDSTKVPASYGVEGIPALFLLDGEGKVIAKGLRGQSIDEAVEAALAALPK